MTARQIKARLAEKNIRQIDLAEKWGVRACTVAQLVNRKMKSARLEKRLAAVLGVTREELRGLEKGAA